VFRCKGMIAGLTLENAVARRPFLPLGRRPLSPKNYTAKSADGPPLGASMSKGCARRIMIVRKAIPKPGRLEFNGRNFAQVVEVSDSRGRIRCYFFGESGNHGSKFPLVPRHYSRNLARCSRFGERGSWHITGEETLRGFPRDQG